ncbi:MAG: hypothetical protein P4L81_01765 [Candidatus Pacebacteria bacterium]|nr:hypothetical protein [Candidatus Paceibacterota bacterium]
MSQCTCAEGNAAACTNGSGNPGGNGGNCPVGYTFEANACAFTGCPLGYSQQGTQCIFQGCPNGYVQQGTQCVFVGCSAGYICLNGNQYYENAQCSISASATQQCNYGCSGGVCLPPPAPAIATWQVKPTLVKSGETAVIAWQAQNVSSCTVVGSNGDGNGSNSTGTWTGTSGSQVSSKLTGQTIYTITCQGLPGSNPASASAQTTVNIVPTFNEQ